MDADSVIIEPVLTEKANLMREGDRRKYVFKVSPRANKFQIMTAIREMFSVNPTSCRVINVKPKPRASRSRSGFRPGRTASWKKAIVTLPNGQRIEIFEGT